MKKNPIKILNIFIIIFACVSIFLYSNLIASSNDVYSMIVNDEGANEFAEMLKDDSSNNNISSQDINRYEQLLKNNGYNLSDVVQQSSNVLIILLTGLFIFAILLNILVVVLSIIVYRRSTDEALIFFTTKFAVFILVVSILTLNFINAILSIFLIICIRKKMLTLV